MLCCAATACPIASLDGTHATGRVTKTAPGRLWYAVAALLAVAGIAACTLLVMKFVQGLTDTPQFLAPGKFVFATAKPGRYVLWHEYRTVFGGRNYAVPEVLPDGARISVIESTGGAGIAVRPSTGLRSSTDGAERVAVAVFRIAEPGRYEVVVDGVFAPRVMSVGHNPFPGVLFDLAGAAAALVGGLGVGGALALWAWFGRNARAVVNTEGILTGGVMQENESPDDAGKVLANEHSSRQLATLVYALQAASFLMGVTFIAAVVVNYVKRDEIAGTWIESHFRWQIRTFWFCLLWGAVGFALMVVVVGFAIMGATAIWLVYRIVKGWIRLSEGKPMYV